MFKNVASQKLTVIAFADAGHATLDAGEVVTGDAANITCKVEQDDDGTRTAVVDTNPTETEDGQYVFDITAGECNGDKLTFYPESSTAGVQVVCLPSNVIYTRPRYFSDWNIGSDGVGESNAVQISGDSTAADNLESMFDGTGYEDNTAPSSRAQVAAIGSSTGGAFNFVAEADNSASAIQGKSLVGTINSGTFSSTQATDGTPIEIQDAANVITYALTFDVGAVRESTSVNVTANVDGNTDQIVVQAYDFDGSAWETIGVLSGSGSSSYQTLEAPLLSKHTSSTGKVHIAFDTVSTTPSLLQVDSVFVSAVAKINIIGYTNASVWVDEVAGTSTGTLEGVDATVTNRSDDFDNAQTVAAGLGYSTITITPGNIITLTAALQGYTVNNVQATLNGGSQDVDSTRINGGFLTGTFTRAGTGVPTFSNCNLNNITTDRVACLNNCGILGTFTMSEAGVYVFNDAQAAGATSLATLDFNSLAATASFQRWSGDLTVNNLVTGATLRLHCVSGGDITLNGADATVNITGTVGTITNNLTGSPTVTNNGVTLANINAQADQAISDANDGSFTVTLADSVTHGGASAIFHLGRMEISGIASNASFLVTGVAGSPAVHIRNPNDGANAISIFSGDGSELLTVGTAVQIMAASTSVDANAYEIKGEGASIVVEEVYPANFNTLAIANNAVASNSTRILGTAISESSAGRIAGNFNVFWDNDNALTTQTVDDVGSGGGGGGSCDENAISTTVIAGLVPEILAVSAQLQQSQANTLSAYQASTWSQQIDELVNIVNRDDIVFVLKRSLTEDDSRALLKISENNGLEVVNGSTDLTSLGLIAGDASITPGTETAPADVTINVESNVMALMPEGRFRDGLKLLYAAGSDTALRNGYTRIFDAAVSETS